MTTSNPNLRCLRFGDFEADLRSGELLKHGRKLKLQEQPFQVLAALLAASGEVVTREELRQKIWPADAFDEYNKALNTAVTKIRQVLDDSAENPRYIETLPRRGYRFLLPVTAVESSSEVTPGLNLESAATTDEKDTVTATATTQTPAPVRHRMPWRTVSVLRIVIVGSGLTVLGLKSRLLGKRDSAIQSIAVLPLENLSGDSSQDYFADGMTDELITNLSKIKSLRVVSRTSIVRYKGTRRPLPEIAKELNVDAIVEGSMTRIGDKIRIRTQLIDAAKDKHLWAASYETTLGDILGVQTEIAQEIATEIKVTLTPQEQQSLAQNHRTAVPEAYEANLKGRYYFNQWNAEGWKKSCTYFEQAIKADPAYAPGYAGMADCYSALSSVGTMAPDDAMPKAKDMAEKAIALDDTLAEAHGTLGTLLLNYYWDWPGSHIELEKAVQLNPNNLDTHLRLLSYYRAIGDVDGAIREAKIAQSLDPVSLKACSSLGWVYFFAAHDDQAVSEFQKCLELDSNFPNLHLGLFYTYDHKKLFPQAISELEKHLASDGPKEVERIDKIYRTRGYQAARRAFYEHELKNDKAPFFRAVDYAALGNKEKALDYLEQAYREHSNFMTHVRINSLLDDLRTEPRFQQLVKELRLANE